LAAAGSVLSGFGSAAFDFFVGSAIGSQGSSLPAGFAASCAPFVFGRESSAGPVSAFGAGGADAGASVKSVDPEADPAGPDSAVLLLLSGAGRITGSSGRVSS